MAKKEMDLLAKAMRRVYKEQVEKKEPAPKPAKPESVEHTTTRTRSKGRCPRSDGDT